MSFWSRLYLAQKRKSVRIAFICGLLPFFILLFQNCSQSPLLPLSGASSSGSNQNESTGGNGESYDGKPTWLRLVPGLVCADQSVAIGSLQIEGDIATIITNENACQGIPTIVSADALERSSFSETYIGYKDGVYSQVKDPAKNIADGVFTEAWCRAMNVDRTQSTYEFAVEWQEAGQTANLSLYQATNRNPVPANSTRELNVDRVTYRTSEGSLRVDLAQKIPGTYKVAGLYAGRIDGVERQINVECLMGGQFDSIAPKFELNGSANQTLALGEPLETITPIVNKSTVRFSVDNVLPSGLHFDPNTGVISGVAQSKMARQSFGVSATFVFGKITRPVTIAVGDSVRAGDLAALKSALQQATQIAPLPLIVKLDAAAIDLGGANLVVNGDVSILGTQTFRSVLDAKTLSNHFDVREGATLDLQYLNLVGGKSRSGGSIHAKKATVIVRDCVFEKNESTENGHGGAIFATESSVSITNSEFNNNKAFFNNGNGGAIYLELSTSSSIRDSRFKGNVAQQGGAVFITAANRDIVQIINSTFEDSYAFRGGAVNIQYSPVAITDSKFLRNKSIFDGGALMIQSSDRAWVERSVFDGNIGAGFGSSALYWVGNSWGGYRAMYSSLFVLESTFTRNKSTVPQSGAILNHLGEVILRGSKFSENESTYNCHSLAPVEAPFKSLGENLSQDGSCPL